MVALRPSQTKTSEERSDSLEPLKCPNTRRPCISDQVVTSVPLETPSNAE
jgi:hypothetical protein